MNGYTTRLLERAASRAPRRFAMPAIAMVTVLVGCGDRLSGPVSVVTPEEAAIASISIFRTMVARNISVVQEPTSSSITEDVECTVSGTATTLTAISGTVGDETATLRYELGINHDQCVESGGAGVTVELNATGSATGIVGDVLYRALGNGDILVEGFMVGRVEVTTDSGTDNCQFRADIFGNNLGGAGVSYQIRGRLCEARFDIFI